jgi:hypothetical protein
VDGAGWARLLVGLGGPHRRAEHVEARLRPGPAQPGYYIRQLDGREEPGLDSDHGADGLYEYPWTRMGSLGPADIGRSSGPLGELGIKAQFNGRLQTHVKRPPVYRFVQYGQFHGLGCVYTADSGERRVSLVHTGMYCGAHIHTHLQPAQGPGPGISGLLPENA